MSALEEKLIDAYVVLRLANRKTASEVPFKLREEVEVRKAEKEIEILEQEMNKQDEIEKEG